MHAIFVETNARQRILQNQLQIVVRTIGAVFGMLLNRLASICVKHDDIARHLGGFVLKLFSALNL
jgi:hypothetical protein